MADIEKLLLRDYYKWMKPLPMRARYASWCGKFNLLTNSVNWHKRSIRMGVSYRHSRREQTNVLMRIEWHWSLCLRLINIFQLVNRPWNRIKMVSYLVDIGIVATLSSLNVHDVNVKGKREQQIRFDFAHSPDKWSHRLITDSITFRRVFVSFHENYLRVCVCAVWRHFLVGTRLSRAIFPLIQIESGPTTALRSIPIGCALQTWRDIPLCVRSATENT